MGKLLQRISKDDAKLLGGDLLLKKPGDVWVYGHGSYSDKVKRIAHEQGIQFMVPVQILTLRREFAPGGWKHYWGQHVFQECLDHDLFLKDKQGNLLRFDYAVFGYPYFPNWCKVDDARAQRWAGYLLEHWDGMFWLDQMWEQMYYWMLEDGVSIDDIADYSPIQYLAGVQRFLAAMHGHVGFINGWDGWSDNGYRIMYESIDQRNMTEEARWKDIARCFALGDVLSVQGTLRQSNSVPLAELWARSPHLAEFKDPAMRTVAISINKYYADKEVRA